MPTPASATVVATPATAKIQDLKPGFQGATLEKKETGRDALEEHILSECFKAMNEDAQPTTLFLGRAEAASLDLTSFEDAPESEPTLQHELDLAGIRLQVVVMEKSLSHLEVYSTSAPSPGAYDGWAASSTGSTLP